MAKSTILNKQIFKKWQFWAIVAVIGVIGLLTQDTTKRNEAPEVATNTSTSTPPAGKLALLNKSDFIGKEGLVVFKDLRAKGYTVTAKYENEKVAAANQDHTDQFAAANINSCSDRLGWDAYIVSDLRQNGDSVAIITTVKSNNNQSCPAGTTDDR